LAMISVLFFFFSSRRRHTRSKRDWSSDVCSSDLEDICTYRRADMGKDWCFNHCRALSKPNKNGYQEPRTPIIESEHNQVLLLLYPTVLAYSIVLMLFIYFNVVICCYITYR